MGTEQRLRRRLQNCGLANFCIDLSTAMNCGKNPERIVEMEYC